MVSAQSINIFPTGHLKQTATLKTGSRIQLPAKHGTVTLRRMFASLAYSTDRINKT
jgi:hypothetical protein